MPRITALFFLVSLLPGTGGCLVDSRYGQCSADADCLSGETCEVATGRCYVQCQSDLDCYVNNLPVGKTCAANHCVFAISDGVAAPNFCLDVVNPGSQHYKKNLCLSDLKGTVVAIYFALLG